MTEKIESDVHPYNGINSGEEKGSHQTTISMKPNGKTNVSYALPEIQSFALT